MEARLRNLGLGICTLVLSALASEVHAQAARGQSRVVPPAPTFTVQRSATSVRVDGVLDDEAWRSAVEIPLRWEWTPGDMTEPPVRTVCRVTFDADRLFIGCKAYDDKPEEIRAHLMDRDDTGRLVLDDHLNILIDPFNDQRRAFQFRINPHGVQADAILSTAEGFEDFSWDAVWASAGHLDPDGYSVEMGIPFRSLRFPETSEAMTWGFLFERSWPRNVRHRMQANPFDRNNSCLLCQANKVTGFRDITPGKNVEAVPAVTSRKTDTRSNFPSGPLVGGDVEGSFGADLRWSVTPNLAVNVTGNPDFSQIEADVAQLDVNTRFALFFPEKRPFFLEGADFFNTPINAVFTRTVADPDVGFKLTGKVGPRTSNVVAVFGARDALTNILFPSNQGSFSTSLAQDAYTAVGRYRRDLGAASYVGGLYTGRYGDGYSNQLAGADVFHRLSNSTSFRAQYLVSATEYPDSLATRTGQPVGSFRGGALSLQVNRNTADWFLSASYDDRSPMFRADAGFVSRVDTRSLNATAFRVIRANSGWFTQILAGVQYGQVHDHDGTLTDQSVTASVSYAGPLQSSAQPYYSHTRVRFQGTLYELDGGGLHAGFRPSANIGFSLATAFGETVDFTNNRESSQLILAPGVRFSVGRGLGIDVQHVYQRLSFAGAEVFTANLFQSKVLYHFNVRTFVRAIVQYRNVQRNLDNSTVPLNAEDRGLFGQFLFSYKVNPQTVFFLGYSENQAGTQDFDLTRANRTLFAKVGYNWRP